jgi:hypothetical protein
MGGESRPLKSAYELALERLEARGMEPPREDALPEAVKREIAEVRRVCRAKLAELEILHRNRLRQLSDPQARKKEEEAFLLERKRIEEEAERKIEKLRAANR